MVGGTDGSSARAYRRVREKTLAASRQCHPNPPIRDRWTTSTRISGDSDLSSRPSKSLDLRIDFQVEPYHRRAFHGCDDRQESGQLPYLAQRLESRAFGRLLSKVVRVPSVEAASRLCEVRIAQPAVDPLARTCGGRRWRSAQPRRLSPLQRRGTGRIAKAAGNCRTS